MIGLGLVLFVNCSQREIENWEVFRGNSVDLGFILFFELQVMFDLMIKLKVYFIFRKKILYLIEIFVLRLLFNG